MDSKEACEVIDRIRSHFGIDRTFEGEYEGMSPYWVLVATIISQQTSERNSRKLMKNCVRNADAWTTCSLRESPA